MREAAIVAGLGTLLGLAGNAVSPRGLTLTRDYFPSTQTAGGAKHEPVPGVTESSAEGDPEATASSEAETRLRARGLEPVNLEATLALFRDPLYEQELVVFVDARNDRSYREGHIPGAYPFDRYYPERYLPNVLPAVLGALTIVVYCGGGDCEDSEFAALDLMAAGVPAENLRVYPGGFSEWAGRGLPVELGQRHSGQLKGGGL